MHLASRAARLNRGTLPPLVLMTDDLRLPDPVAAAKRLPERAMVVLRARDSGRRAMLAELLVTLARAKGLMLLVADDPELADRVQSDGVHLPEAHVGLAGLWRARRPAWLITASAHSVAGVLRAQQCGAHAVFLSPVFPTKSHPGRPALGPMRLRAIARQTQIPIYALGGIDQLSARRLLGAPIAGLAAIGAFASA